MGARGNSGVILSQMVRGAMEVLGHSEAADPKTLSTALRHATDTAYRAVRKPVEGTMLTVLREMAEAAEAETTSEPETLMARVVNAGWQSVERTPTLLKVLADAGVVDAGGYGLVVLVEGAAQGGGAWETPISTHVGSFPYDELAALVDETEGEESRYTYCTSFLVSGHDARQGLLGTKPESSWRQPAGGGRFLTAQGPCTHR